MRERQAKKSGKYSVKLTPRDGLATKFLCSVRSEIYSIVSLCCHSKIIYDILHNHCPIKTNHIWRNNVMNVIRYSNQENIFRLTKKTMKCIKSEAQTKTNNSNESVQRQSPLAATDGTTNRKTPRLSKFGSTNHKKMKLSLC